MLPVPAWRKQRRKRALWTLVLYVILLAVSAVVLLAIMVDQPVGRAKAMLHGKGPYLSGGNATGPLPDYADIIEYEARLPQQNLDLPFPEGRHGRYVKFTNQPEKIGWNNVLNEILLGTHLAYRAERAYVFQDFGWPPTHFPWPTLLWPIHYIPLNALISGPTAGGPWDKNDSAPRSISAKWFEVVCPREDTEVIISDRAKDPVRGKDAKVILEYWVELLNRVEKRCVDVRQGGTDNFPQTFDLWTISSSLVLPLWPEFRDSPASRLLATSPLVHSAIHKNEHLLFDSNSIRDSSRYDKAMAIHIRRGDYEDACLSLANHNSTFYQWNLLPDLPDPLITNSPPPGAKNQGEAGWENTSENVAMVQKRCWPTESELVEKIMHSKRDREDAEGTKMNVIYVMTNGDEVWFNSLKNNLLARGWDRVMSALELELNPEELSVAMAIDMDIGRRAGVFIGNGWSSLTSNVVHRRLMDGHPPASIRFW